MNITDYEYSRSPEGYFYGASGMKLKVHDLSKFGLLLMNNGVYEGKRIVSYLSHIEDDSQNLKESMERNILGII